MRIHEYGEIILCKNITFEDNQLDMEIGHPGIVLLPTSEYEDEVHCLYMTTDGNRAKKEKGKFVKLDKNVEKRSYVNIQQIVKRINMKDCEMNKLDDDEFKELLQTFYDYQMGLNPLKKEFLEIKSKIETLLQILEFNKEFGITTTTSRHEIDTLASLEDKKKRTMVYCANLILSGNSDNSDLENKVFVSEKDKKYFETLLQTYNRIKNLNFDKIDFNNPNNEMRQVYIDLRNQNYLINIDTLLKDVSNIFSMNSDKDKIGKLIKTFVSFEQKREVEKANAKAEKSEARKNKKIEDHKNFLRRNSQRRRGRDVAKYGNFDWR